MEKPKKGNSDRNRCVSLAIIVRIDHALYWNLKVNHKTIKKYTFKPTFLYETNSQNFLSIIFS